MFFPGLCNFLITRGLSCGRLESFSKAFDFVSWWCASKLLVEDFKASPFIWPFTWKCQRSHQTRVKMKDGWVTQTHTHTHTYTHPHTHLHTHTHTHTHTQTNTLTVPLEHVHTVVTVRHCMCANNFVGLEASSFWVSRLDLCLETK